MAFEKRSAEDLQALMDRVIERGTFGYETAERWHRLLDSASTSEAAAAQLRQEAQARVRVAFLRGLRADGGAA